MAAESTRDWMVQKIAEEAGLKEEEVSPDALFDSFHLDSLSIVSLAYELEKFVEKPVDPTIFGEYKTINEVISWLEKQN